MLVGVFHTEEGVLAEADVLSRFSANLANFYFRYLYSIILCLQFFILSFIENYFFVYFILFLFLSSLFL